MSKVVLILIDGLRPDAISAARSPRLWKLCQEGTYSLKARSVMPCITLPCHMSIFHSVPPTRHGITSNDWSPMARPLPGLIEQAKAADLRCAFFYNWDPLRNLSKPDSLFFSYCCNNSETDMNGDERIAAAAAEMIPKDMPDFAFVYLGTMDTAGHWLTWMSEEYLKHLEVVDGILGGLLDALPSEYTILLQSDHGGHDRSHGEDIPEDMTIPWMVRGAGIRQGYEITQPVSLLDTAPTIARLLGISPVPQWEGRCVEEAFSEAHVSG